MPQTFIKVSLTRDFGAVGKMTIEAQAQTPVDANKGLIEFDAITVQINNLFDHFIDQHLPRMKSTPIPTSNTVLVDAEKMYVTLDKGKKYVKVICGEWREHGVVFWPEHLKACGIDIRSIPDSGHVFKEGTKAEIEIVGGKPKRVLKLVRPNVS